MKLMNKTRNLVLVQDLMKTAGLLSRMKGLIGSEQIQPHQALWIPANNSIHTFFMRYDIDVIFADKDLRVKAIHKKLNPGRFIMPVWSAFHTFEFLGGQLNSENIQVGDVLHVGN